MAKIVPFAWEDVEDHRLTHRDRPFVGAGVVRNAGLAADGEDRPLRVLGPELHQPQIDAPLDLPHRQRPSPSIGQESLPGALGRQKIRHPPDDLDRDLAYTANALDLLRVFRGARPMEGRLRRFEFDHRQAGQASHQPAELCQGGAGVDQTGDLDASRQIGLTQDPFQRDRHHLLRVPAGFLGVGGEVEPTERVTGASDLFAFHVDGVQNPRPAAAQGQRAPAHVHRAGEVGHRRIVCRRAQHEQTVQVGFFQVAIQIFLYDDLPAETSGSLTPCSFPAAISLTPSPSPRPTRILFEEAWRRGGMKSKG